MSKMHKPFFSLLYCNSYCFSCSYILQALLLNVKLSKFALWTWLRLPVLLYGTINFYWFLLIHTNLGDHWGWWKSVCQPIHIDTNYGWLLQVATCNHMDEGLVMKVFFACGLMSDMLICMENIAWSFMTPNVFLVKQHSTNSPWLLSFLFSLPLSVGVLNLIPYEEFM